MGVSSFISEHLTPSLYLLHVATISGLASLNEPSWPVGSAPLKSRCHYVCLRECTCEVEKEEQILTGVRENKHDEQTHV